MNLKKLYSDNCFIQIVTIHAWHIYLLVHFTSTTSFTLSLRKPSCQLRPVPCLSLAFSYSALAESVLLSTGVPGQLFHFRWRVRPGPNWCGFVSRRNGAVRVSKKKHTDRAWRWEWADQRKSNHKPTQWTPAYALSRIPRGVNICKTFGYFNRPTYLF